MVGANLIARVWDYKYNLGDGDDDVGGSQPSGTVIHEAVQLRLKQNTPTQALLEQGIEDISTFIGHFVPHTLQIENNNQVEIIAPANSQHYGKFYRVAGDPQYTSMGASDSRGFLTVNLKRIEKSRSLQ